MPESACVQSIPVHDSTYLEIPEGSKVMPDYGECWGRGGWTRSIIVESAISIAIDFEWDFF